MKILLLIFSLLIIEELLSFNRSTEVKHYQYEKANIMAGKKYSYPLKAPKKISLPGPVTPEVQKFTPHNVTELVDPFTGDFSYSIPLMDIEGYPLTITYNAGVKPEDEASNVGLGWNLNIGQITRNMRGLPDDFKGDEVTKSLNIKPRVTVGGSLNQSLEIFGLDAAFAIGTNTTIKYNNYTGVGLDFGFNLGLTANKQIKSQTSDSSFNASFNIGSQFSTSAPPSITGGGGLDITVGSESNKNKSGVTVGTSLNSLEGMKGINFSTTKIPGSFNCSFAAPAPTPPSQFPMLSTAFSRRIGLSAELTGITPGASVEGFVHVESLLVNTENIPAYGYIYEDKSNGMKEKYLLDFNREKDGPFVKQAPVLPIPVSTYDVFTVAGQGISGQFRPYRSDIGTVHDPQVIDGDISLNVGAQIKIGNILGVGADITGGGSLNFIGKWKEFNELSKTFSFQSQKAGSKVNNIYFRNPSEFTVLSNQENFEKLGGFSPVRSNIVSQAINSTKLIKANGRETDIGSGSFVKQSREPQNIVFSYLTSDEAIVDGLEKKIISHNLNSLNSVNEISRDEDYRRGHHISEIKVLRNDGVNYLYGIPAYNVKYKEVAFNIGNSAPITQSNLASYTASGERPDNDLTNEKGQNHYFSSTEIPPYAYAYLLTAITSPDYVDITGDGPSIDDFGNYTKFNYTRVHDNFTWRTPYEENKGSFSAGNFSDGDDNTANYVYGEKEIWYIHSIESRNFIARFTLSDRDDALGVSGENGGIDINKKLKKISKIDLFSKSELLKNGINTKPVKSINLIYDYSLCKKAPGSINPLGKLTLKKIQTSYYNSEKGKFSPYSFEYLGENVDYIPNAVDRWGTFKKTNVNGLSSQDFPYTKQERSRLDEIAAWNLSAIQLPSGGKISITYEADDYAYVQDKRAMEMLQVAGFADDISAAALSNKLYNTLPSIETISEGNVTDIINNVNKYLVFKLKKPLAKSQFGKLFEYVKNIDQLYFNFRINVVQPPGSLNTQKFEKVDGFINIDSITIRDSTNRYGFWPSSVSEGNICTMGYIKLTQLPRYNFLNVHPITWLAWQKGKTIAPLIYNDDLPEVSTNVETTVSNFGKWLVSKFKSTDSEFLQMFAGYYDMMYLTNRGAHVDTSKSFIRLNSFDLKKYGGGIRVKQILINDRWGEMQKSRDPSLNSVYGQNYEYTIEENNQVISSGVASYEPVIGGDENPFVRADKYTVDRVLAPDDVLNSTAPYGESFFQSAVVGYSRIKISNIHRGNKLKRRGAGFSVQEFYTAKDFPTITDTTSKAHKQFYLQPPNPLIDIITHTAAQGFYIETNNMHGKNKSLALFSETDTINPIKETNYFYKTNKSTEKRLDNIAQVAFNGEISDRLIGIDYDVIADARQISNLGGALDVQLNVDYFQAGPVPIIIPVPVPWPSYAYKELKTHVITKVVQRSGIIDSVQEINNGAITTIQNILFDGLTGDVLVTKHTDEFGDYYYSTKIPAYWTQENMGPAYINIGYRNKLTIENSKITLTNAKEIFSPGDKLLINQDNETPNYAWVFSVIANTVTLINESGDKIDGGDGTYNLKIVSSGIRNMTSASAGEVITKSNPLKGDNLNFENVIDASAVEFKDRWQTYQGIRIKYPDHKCKCDNNNINISLLNDVLSLLSYSQLGICKDTLINTLLRGVAYKVQVFHSNNNVQLHLTKNLNLENTCQINLEVIDPAITLSPCPAVKFSPIKVDPSGDCSYSNSFTVNADDTSTNNNDVDFRGKISCLSLKQCHLVEDGIASSECNIKDGVILNPFLAGSKNNWRPAANYKYLTARNYSEISINKEGFYRDFSPFWTINALGIQIEQNADKSKWKRADSATVIDPFGHILESRNAINNYSSTLYGYSYTLPIASAQNAHYSDIAFENFEDYHFNNTLGLSTTGKCQLPPHWKFENTSAITDKESHTGRYSLEVRNDSIVSLRMPNLICNLSSTTIFNSCDLIRNFSPGRDKYLISAWVKMKIHRMSPPRLPSTLTRGGDIVVPGESGSLNLRFFRTEENLREAELCELLPVGRMIDGWQLFSGIFEITNEKYKALRLIAKNLQLPSTGILYQAFIDDIRIHPLNAMMETFVYDPETLRLSATLDPENFATFYEYDMEGNLTHLKKETERGIKMIKEIRAAKPKTVD